LTVCEQKTKISPVARLEVPVASTPTPLDPPERIGAPRAAAADLLRDLGDGRIRTGGWLFEQLAQQARERRLPTGLARVDRLLGGGFPRGRLSEITGPLSSGRTSLALALAAAATRAGEVVAWVDAADALDPPSLEAAGVEAGHLLWVRPPNAGNALHCAERLLLARGFALVVLDLARGGTADWLRFARHAAASGTALVRMGSAPLADSFAALVVDLRATRMRFAARPAWLEALETRVALVRHRFGPAEGMTPVRWKVSAG
jgi:hypothetical protein